MKGYNNAVGPQIRIRKKRGTVIPFLAFLSLGAGLQAATQFFAHNFRYPATLGPQIYQLYPPWGIIQWAEKWYNQYPDVFMRAGNIGLMVTSVGMISLIVAKMVMANSLKVNKYLHGSARWADVEDIRTAGLIPRARTIVELIEGRKSTGSSGVYVGMWIDKRGRQHYLRHDGPEHVLCYAPTRSGKGVGLVVPTLLSWGHSAVITDLKGELWSLTAGWRQKHAKNRVLRFEPASLESVCWNPLDEIRIDENNMYNVGDVQNLATLLVDPDGKGLENHWQKTSQALLVGLILHALYKSNAESVPATLPEIDAMLADKDRNIGGLWQEMLSYKHANGCNDAVVSAAARDMMDRPEEEAGSVLSTAKSCLALYRDPVVNRNVSISEFRIRDLMHHDHPVSLYIVTNPNDKTRLRPLVRVLVNMIVRLLADHMDFENGRPKTNYKHRLLIMLDEFPSLGRLEILQESLAFIAGYGIKCYLICQDINQLKSRETGYGHDESITSNCHVQNAFPPNRLETAEYLSRLTGQTTVVKEQVTTSGGRSSALLGQVSRTMQEIQRPLLTPDECLRMPGPVKNESGDITEAGDMVIYVAGSPCIYGKQPLYFKDAFFQRRAAISAPKSSEKLYRVSHPYDIEKVITI